MHALVAGLVPVMVPRRIRLGLRSEGHGTMVSLRPTKEVYIKHSYAGLLLVGSSMLEHISGPPSRHS